MGTFFRAYDGLLQLTGILVGAVVGLAALGIGVDVFLRNLGFGSIFWMLEVVEYAILFVAMAGTAYVFKIGRHVSIDLVTNSLPPRTRRVVALLALGVTTAVSAILLTFGLITTIKSFESGAVVYKHFTYPEWMPLALVPFGFLLLTIECLRELWALIAGEPAPAHEDDREGL
ncbi:MAG: TRAP transporter small permease [Bauldia litoralis]